MKKIFLLIALVIIGLSVSACSTKPANIGDSGYPSSFVSATNSSVSVSAATSTAVLSLNGVRQYASICNDSANTVYLAFGAAATASKGIRLASATCYEITSAKLYLGAVYAIASSSTSTLMTLEK